MRETASYRKLPPITAAEEWYKALQTEFDHVKRLDNLTIEYRGRGAKYRVRIGRAGEGYNSYAEFDYGSWEKAGIKNAKSHVEYVDGNF